MVAFFGLSDISDMALRSLVGTPGIMSVSVCWTLACWLNDARSATVGRRCSACARDGERRAHAQTFVLPGVHNGCGRLRLPEVVRRTGLSRSTLYNRIAAGAFPRPLRLGDRSVGWLESEVDDWIQRLVELRDRMQAD